MQVVERRREQAAEVVEPRLEQAAERSPGWTYLELPKLSRMIHICCSDIICMVFFEGETR